MMNFLLNIGFCLIALLTVIECNAQQSIKELNMSLLSANTWQVDEFYIDSLLRDKTVIKTPLNHYYVQGNFVRSNVDTLVEGMYWELISDNKLKVSAPSQGYVEYADVIYVSSSILITRQNIQGSDGRNYLVEYRFKPYFKNAN